MCVRGSVAGLVSLLCGCVFAQQSQSPYQCRPIAAVKVTVPPKIDGDLSDACWKQAAKAEGFIDLATNAPAKDQTIAYLAYDAKNIYVAFDCRDSQPDKVIARETVRDAKFQNQSSGNGNGNGNNNNEDNVEFDIDPFRTYKGQDISQFSVNAIGTPSAALAGGRANKAEWKGDFIVAAKRTSTGWTAEMQIPWASINYPESSQPAVIGVDFQRYQNRTAIASIWSNVTNQGFIDKEGCWNGVVLPRSSFKPKLSLLPYVLGEAQPGGGSVRTGLDMRYTVTPELTAVGSIEPDFSTVEGAITNIQFSHQEKFIPEHRPFFLEGAGNFNPQMNFNNIGALFYSNRIDSFDVGSKLYGKIDPQDTLGFFDALRFDKRNDMVFRLRHEIGPTASYGVYLGEKNTPGDNNTVSALDFHDRWGKTQLEAWECGSNGPTAGGGASIYNLSYQDKYATSMIEYQDVSNRFQDEDGFVPFTGQKGALAFGDWSAQYKRTALRSFEATLVGLYWMHENGLPFYRQLDYVMQAVTKKDDLISLELDYDRFDAALDQYATLTLTHGVTNRFCQYGIQAQTGILNEHAATFISPTLSLRLLKKLDLTYSGSFLNLQGLTQQHILTANYVVSPTISFGGRAVIQNGQTNWYLFYHNSGGKGTELYFLVGDPNAPKFVRKLELKLVFAY